MRHLTTRALDFGTDKRRSTPATESDFESKREDKEDLSPNNERGPKSGRRGRSWTEVRTETGECEVGTIVDIRTEEYKSK